MCLSGWTSFEAINVKWPKATVDSSFQNPHYNSVSGYLHNTIKTNQPNIY